MTDGFYLIENHVAYSTPKDCLRVIRDGLTWSTLATDVPHAIELRDDGELYAGMSLQGPDGAELRTPLERAGTWAATPRGLELRWHARVERLVPQKPSRALPEPPLHRPRARVEDVLGLVIERRTVWTGRVALDGATELAIHPGDDLEATFARARDVVDTLRAGALARVKRDLAGQVFDQYVDYLRELDRPALPTAEALAQSLRADTLALDEHGNATLWFGRVLGEHSVLAVLSHDGQTCELSQP